MLACMSKPVYACVQTQTCLRTHACMTLPALIVSPSMAVLARDELDLMRQCIRCYPSARDRLHDPRRACRCCRHTLQESKRGGGAQSPAGTGTAALRGARSAGSPAARRPHRSTPRLSARTQSPASTPVTAGGDSNITQPANHANAQAILRQHHRHR